MLALLRTRTPHDDFVLATLTGLEDDAVLRVHRNARFSLFAVDVTLRYTCGCVAVRVPPRLEKLPIIVRLMIVKPTVDWVIGRSRCSG